MMEIKVAKYCGFCYGVKRAVELAQKAASEHVNGATLGPLIHNPQLIRISIPCLMAARSAPPRRTGKAPNNL